MVVSTGATTGALWLKKQPVFRRPAELSLGEAHKLSPVWDLNKK